VPDWRFPTRSDWGPSLRHRNFRLFIGAQAVSLVGTHMQNLAQAWLVLLLTGNPLLVGLVTAIQGLPVATLALLGGVVADRLRKRRVLLATQGSMFLLALVVGVLALTGRVEVWHVMVLAFALGCANAIDMPTRQAFVVEMVGSDDVGSAVGLNSAIYNAGRLVGPAFAGLLIAAATQASGSGVVATGVVFVVNAATFGSVFVGLLLIREDELYPIERPGGPRQLRQVPRDVADGIAYLRSTRPVLVTLLVPGTIAILAVNFTVLVPVYAREAGLGADGLGLLLAAVGIGSLVSALWIGLGGAAGPRVIVAGAALLSLATLLLGVVSSAPAWPPLLFAAGLGASAMRTAANSQIQVATPGPLRGRVMSVFTIVFEGLSPMGGLAAGALAAAGGTRAAFAITGVASLVVLSLGAKTIMPRSARLATASSRGRLR
jgi:MFS family permease